MGLLIRRPSHSLGDTFPHKGRLSVETFRVIYTREVSGNHLFTTKRQLSSFAFPCKGRGTAERWMSSQSKTISRREMYLSVFPCAPQAAGRGTAERWMSSQSMNISRREMYLSAFLQIHKLQPEPFQNVLRHGLKLVVNVFIFVTDNRNS